MTDGQSQARGQMSPSAIPLSEWQEMFDVYAGRRINADAFALYESDWNTFRQLLDGEIDSTRYRDDRGLHKAIERGAAACATSLFSRFRPSLNSALYQRIQATRAGEHWATDRDDPQTRMYLNVVRSVNTEIAATITKWAEKKWATYNDLIDPAQLDEIIDRGMDEAILSARLRMGTDVAAFIVTVLKRRIADQYRTGIGRTEHTREHRPRFISLHKPLNAKGFDLSDVLETKIDSSFIHRRTYEINDEDTVAKCRDFVRLYMPKHVKFFDAYTDALRENPSATYADMAEKANVELVTYTHRIAYIIQTLRKEGLALDRDTKGQIR